LTFFVLNNAGQFCIAFKTYASRSGISMKELPESSFDEYERAHSLEKMTKYLIVG
jgi:hypothetical protein